MARSRRWLRPVLFGCAVAIGVVALYVWHLDRTAVRQFEGRRWTLPARVYAAPVELYSGLQLSQSQFERELRRLQYRPESAVTRPGTYRIRGTRMDVALRAARFADESRAAQILSVTFAGDALSKITDTFGAEVPIARLEPLPIGSIFPTHGEDRIVVAPNEVPPLLPKALKAIEDRKFDTHYGVDPTAIARALWANVRAGQVEQGGSTLTQQLVRSYFLSTQQTVTRKLKEAVMAIALDTHFTKTDLMNAYINEIFLGQDGRRAIHGFGLASQFYFGKPLSELELPEVALLVTLVRGPSFYDPRRHPDRARKRRDLVLKVLAEQHVITEAEAVRAARLPLGVTLRPAGSYYPAYLDFVRRTLRRDYPEKELTEAGLRIFTSLDPRVQELAEQTLERELARLDRARKQTSSQLEGSIVVTAPQSGDVMAIIGSRHVGFDGFNRALDSRRPIGSLVKPFVYLTAVESGAFNATTIVPDQPIDLKLPTGEHWKPENFTRETNGEVPVVRAMAESLNLATVGVGLRVGLDPIVKTLQDFGLSQPPQKVPAMLLGAVNAAPIDVAQIYNGLANGGFRTPLRAVTAVISDDNRAIKGFPVRVTPVGDAAAVYEVDRMMQNVMERGTGRAGRALLPGSLVVAGKSGTSSDLRDSWFAGFSGSHLIIVWVGYDDNRPTGLTGSTGALPIWARLMAGAQAGPWMPAVPEGVEDIDVDYMTGQRADSRCSNDRVSIAVPVTATLTSKAGCGGQSPGLLDKVRDALHGIIHP